MPIPQSAGPARRVALVVLAFVALSCGGGVTDLVIPPEPLPGPLASVTIVSGDRQTAGVGQALGQPIVVVVRDAAQRPLAGKPVRFTANDSTDRLRDSLVLTDANGVASTQWTLGQHAFLKGYSVTAQAYESSGEQPRATVAFTASALRVQFWTLTRRVRSGETVPITIQLVDEANNHAANVKVRFITAAGSGSVSPATAVTSSAGTASASWTLSSAVGSQEYSVALGDALGGSAQTRFAVMAGNGERIVLTDEVFAGCCTIIYRVDATMVVADTVRFHAALRDSSGAIVTGAPISWRSVDANVGTAEVDAGGFVRAMAPGVVKIVASSGAVVSDTIVLGVHRQLPVTNVVVGRFACFSYSSGGISCSEGGAAPRPGVAPGTEGIQVPVSGYLGLQGILRCGLDSAVGGYTCFQPRSFGTSFLRVGEGLQFTAASTRANGHVCAITAEGKAYCWGDGRAGRLGAGDTLTSPQPVLVAGNHVFRSISAGDSHSCGVDADGAAWCWGLDADGALGHGIQTTSCLQSSGGSGCSLVPVRVAGSTRFRTISAGDRFTCGVTTTGTVACWGRGQSGATGNGASGPTYSPTTITGGRQYATVSSGAAHACAVRADGTVECWGSDAGGRTGTARIGATVSQPEPVIGGYRFTAVSAGDEASCGISEGLLFCWGGGMRPFNTVYVRGSGPLRVPSS